MTDKFRNRIRENRPTTISKDFGKIDFDSDPDPDPDPKPIPNPKDISKYTSKTNIISESKPKSKPKQIKIHNPEISIKEDSTVKNSTYRCGNPQNLSECIDYFGTTKNAVIDIAIGMLHKHHVPDHYKKPPKLLLE